MNREDRILQATGLLAALFGVVAGVAEILAGTVGWAGNKNDPTTLGWVTIGLGVAVGGASVLASRSQRPGAQLCAAAALLVCGLIGLTTAGLAWIPAAIASITAWAMVVRRPRGDTTWRAVARAQWAPALIGVLALIYLAFGIVARGGTGLLGVIGAAVACLALAVRHRSRIAAVAGLMLAAIPFAVVTLWTVVTPLTAVLMLAIGVPYVLDRSHHSPRGAAS